MTSMPTLSALEKVPSCLELEGVDRLISVGHVVGCGGAPHECIQILREREPPS